MNIADIIREMAGRQQMPVYATVTSVDLANSTCDVSPIDGTADILDVRLCASATGGVLYIPSVGSVVGVIFINEAEGFVGLYGALDSIQLGDGTFDGLVKVSELVTKLNNLENDINDLKSALSGWVPVPNDGGAALKTALTAYYGATLTPTVQGDIENEKITHGDF